jgi:hypothetical protein
MHDALRQRLLRRIESLPDQQIYQVLDFIEFLESKYAGSEPSEATGLQRFAESLEDKLRRRAVSPTTIREAFQLISAADRVLSDVSSAGKQILSDLNQALEPPEGTGSGSGREVGTGPAGRGGSRFRSGGDGSAGGPGQPRPPGEPGVPGATPGGAGRGGSSSEGRSEEERSGGGIARDAEGRPGRRSETRDRPADGRDPEHGGHR